VYKNSRPFASGGEAKRVKRELNSSAAYNMDWVTLIRKHKYHVHVSTHTHTCTYIRTHTIDTHICTPHKTTVRTSLLTIVNLRLNLPVYREVSIIANFTENGYIRGA
jgi:hypothetical protein